MKLHVCAAAAVVLLLHAQSAEADIFEQFFGGGGGGGGGGQMQRRGRGGRRRGQDMQIELAVELHEVYNGAKRNAQMQGKNKVCEKCKGTGAKNGKTVRCKTCQGSGQVSRPVQMGPMTVQMQQPCQRCGGKGVTYKQKCRKCQGQGIIEDDKALEVAIEPGMQDGQAIPFEGEASINDPSIVPGDLIFILRVDESRAKFKREGVDLRTHNFISLKEALLGFDHQLTHMDQRTIALEGQGTTQPYEVRTLGGEGMPHYMENWQGRERPKGDLHVEYRVKFPHSVKAKDKKALLEAFQGQWPLPESQTHICAAPPCTK